MTSYKDMNPTHGFIGFIFIFASIIFVLFHEILGVLFTKFIAPLAKYSFELAVSALVLIIAIGLYIALKPMIQEIKLMMEARNG